MAEKKREQERLQVKMSTVEEEIEHEPVEVVKYVTVDGRFVEEGPNGALMLKQSLEDEIEADTKDMEEEKKNTTQRRQKK